MRTANTERWISIDARAKGLACIQSNIILLSPLADMPHRLSMVGGDSPLSAWPVFSESLMLRWSISIISGSSNTMITSPSAWPRGVYWYLVTFYTKGCTIGLTMWQCWVMIPRITNSLRLNTCRSSMKSFFPSVLSSVPYICLNNALYMMLYLQCLYTSSWVIFVFLTGVDRCILSN